MVTEKADNFIEWRRSRISVEQVIVMVSVVMAYIFMAYIFMAYVVMA